MFDVVSWVKDGGWVLPATLKRLEEVLPAEFVHRKIAVDDHSVDDTVRVLKDFGWEVYSNPKTGISSGANYALSKVDCRSIPVEHAILENGRVTLYYPYKDNASLECLFFGITNLVSGILAIIVWLGLRYRK